MSCNKINDLSTPLPLLSYSHDIIDHDLNDNNMIITDPPHVILRNTIAIKNIPPFLMNQDILASTDYFGQFGVIEMVRSIPDKSGTIIHIQYANQTQTKLAQETMDNYYFAETQHTLHVTLAINQLCPYWLNSTRCHNPICSYIHYEVDPQDIIYSEEESNPFYPSYPCTATNSFSSTVSSIDITSKLKMENDALRQQLVELHQSYQSDLAQQRKTAEAECMVLKGQLTDLRQYVLYLEGVNNGKFANESDVRLTEDNVVNIAESEEIQSKFTNLQNEHNRIRKKHCALIRDYNILQRKFSKKSDQEKECKQLRGSLKNMQYQQEILTQKLLAQHNAYKLLENQYFVMKNELDITQKSQNELKELLFNETLNNNQDNVQSQSQSGKDYKLWDWLDVSQWILNLREQQYRKYRVELHRRLKSENVNGLALSQLNETDLYRLGITDYNDRVCLLADIGELIADETSEHDMNDHDVNVYSMEIMEIMEGDLFGDTCEIEGGVYV